MIPAWEGAAYLLGFFYVVDVVASLEHRQGIREGGWFCAGIGSLLDRLSEWRTQHIIEAAERKAVVEEFDGKYPTWG